MMLEFGDESEEDERLEVNALDDDENARELLLEKQMEEELDHTNKNQKLSKPMIGWGDWAGGGIDFQKKQERKRQLDTNNGMAVN